MLDSPMLVDQNMVCGSSKDQRDHFPRIHLDVSSLFSGIHQICIPTFPLIHPRKVIHIMLTTGKIADKLNNCRHYVLLCRKIIDASQKL